VAEARQTFEGSQVIASASTTLVPAASPVVSLRLTPASFVPVLRSIIPNPTVVGSLVTLQGQKMSATQTVLFTTPGTAPPIAVEVDSSEPPVQITIPEGASSGPVIALNSSGVGLGVVQLTIFSPTPTPTPTPSVVVNTIVDENGTEADTDINCSLREAIIANNTN